MNYTVIFPDNVEFTIDKYIISESTKLMRIISQDRGNNIINISEIDSKSFSYVLSFFDYKSKNKEEELNNLINCMDGDTIINFIHCADFLELNQLVNIAGKRLTNIIKNNDIEEIREKLLIT